MQKLFFPCYFFKCKTFCPCYGIKCKNVLSLLLCQMQNLFVLAIVSNANFCPFFPCYFFKCINFLSLLLCNEKTFFLAISSDAKRIPNGPLNVPYMHLKLLTRGSTHVNANLDLALVIELEYLISKYVFEGTPKHGQSLSMFWCNRILSHQKLPKWLLTCPYTTSDKE
jgi:hypothetical protein